MSAAGIVHDPIKGIYMDPNEKTEVHADLSIQEKKQLLKELAA